MSAGVPPGSLGSVRFDERGLVPVVAQDVVSGRVLMMAWMNAEALQRTLESGDVWYWSRSRSALWRKGETSGHTQRLVELRADCDGDTLLAAIHQTGPACHTGERSCFYCTLGAEPSGAAAPASLPAGSMLDRLEAVLGARKSASGERSYTRRLFDGGAAKINEKLVEEAGELAAAIASETEERVVSEAADVVYHALVGLAHRGVPVERVLAELARRFGTSGLDEKASRPPKVGAETPAAASEPPGGG